MKYKGKNKPYLGLLNFEGDVFRTYDEGNGIFTIVDERSDYVMTATAFQVCKIMEGKIPLVSAYERVYNLAEEHVNAKPTRKQLYKFLKLELPAKEVAIGFAKWMRGNVNYEAVVDTFFFENKAYENIEQLYDIYEQTR